MKNNFWKQMVRLLIVLATAVLITLTFCKQEEKSVIEEYAPLGVFVLPLLGSGKGSGSLIAIPPGVAQTN